MKDYLTNVKPLSTKHTTIERVKIKRSRATIYYNSNKSEAPMRNVQRASLHKMSRKSKRLFQAEKTIDLHGMSTDKAFTALCNFFNYCQTSGINKVLIITGGNELRNTTIRKSFQNWVHESFGNYIISCSMANIWHGGQGAFYATLKRKK
ncbi:MAG: hypothetical protein E7015_01690 [Alphaproteobacteria bacterium]|nr:hypothetical protein [Alphaproteobacteria bacterium]